MKKLIIIISLILLVPFCSWAKQYNVVDVMGDSLGAGFNPDFGVYGWVNMLYGEGGGILPPPPETTIDSLWPGIVKHNSSAAGSTLQDWVNPATGLLNSVKSHNPDLVLFQLGGNDFLALMQDGTFSVSDKNRVSQDLAFLLDELSTWDPQPDVVCINYYDLFDGYSTNLSLQYFGYRAMSQTIVEGNQILNEGATARDLNVVDIFGDFLHHGYGVELGAPQHLSPDFFDMPTSNFDIHPVTTGHYQIYENILAKLLELAGSQGVEEWLEPFIAVGSGLGGENTIRVLNINGNITYPVFNTVENSGGEIHVAWGNLDSTDPELEVVCGTGLNGQSLIRVLEPNGVLINTFSAFLNDNPGGEVHVTCGDIDNDGLDEIIAGQGFGGTSRIAAYEVNGTQLWNYRYFFGDDNPGGEMHVGTGDFDGDNQGDEIIIGSGYNGKNRVLVIDGDGTFIGSGTPFGPSNTNGEIHVGGANYNQFGPDEIFVSTGIGGTNEVAVFQLTGELLVAGAVFGSENTGGEVVLSFGDFDGDGDDEIAFAHGLGGQNTIQIREMDLQIRSEGTVFTMEDNPGGGINFE